MNRDVTAPINEQDTSSMSDRRSVFSFTGSGLDYFKLWIVNLLMTIVTVGLYSPWATVRNKQYLYNSTQFDNESFAYLATPMQVLKGRAIAFCLFILYLLLTTVSPNAAGFLFLILAALGPLMVHLSMRFNLRNTSYRHVRFGYSGSIGKAYLLFALYPFLSIFTLGLAFPAVLKLQQEYLASHIKWGNRQFSAQLSYKTFYGAFAIYFGGMIAVFIAFAMFGFLFGVPQTDASWAPHFGFVFGLISYGAFFLLVFVTQGIVTRHIYNSVVLDDVTVKSTLEPLTFGWLNITNIVAIVLTVGLAYPWAKVRMLNYKLTTLSTDDPTSLIDTVTEQQDSPSAVAEEVSNAFHLDAGLSI